MTRRPPNPAIIIPAMVMTAALVGYVVGDNYGTTKTEANTEYVSPDHMSFEFLCGPPWKEMKSEALEGRRLSVGESVIVTTFIGGSIGWTGPGAAP